MADTNYTGPVNPDYRGGYAGEATFAGGGGYDPTASQNYTGAVAPDYRGGYAGEATFAGGGGYDPNQGTARNLGSTAPQALKPDGTPLYDKTFPSILSSGAANRTTGLAPDRASDPIKNDASTRLEDPTKIGWKAVSLPSRVPNPFEEFASMASLFTFACLEPDQYNDPRSYRNSFADLKHIIFSSAGRFDSQRETTAYDQPGLGPPEFYINNFVMRSIIAPTEKTGASNAVAFEFTIYEPYSMGLLLQSLQTAALKAGYINYLDNCPYVLRLDFNGFKEDGTVLSTIKPKFFTMKLTKVTFNVTEGGSSYNVTAIPYNHIGFSDVNNLVYNDVKIVADKSGTVSDILRDSPESLISFLNKQEQKLKDENKIGIPDEYAIEFPLEASDFTGAAGKVEPENGATVDPAAPPILKSVSGKGTTGNTPTDANPTDDNDIGRAGLGFTASSGGNFPFRKESDIVGKDGVINREGMMINPKIRAYQFTQGQSVVSIIENVIKSSDYVTKAMNPENMVNGHIKWFKVDIQIELLGRDDMIGDYARRTTFRIVPYWVHSSIWTNPNAIPPGADEIKKKICKGYDYIYTGQNTDILTFQIDIKNMFFTGANPSPEDESALVANQDQKGTTDQKNAHVANSQGPQVEAQVATYGRPRVKKTPKALEPFRGGSGEARTEVMVAEAFHRAFLESGGVSLVSIELEILGDPYWIVDSGISNYFAKAESSTDQITADGTMNYEAGQVYIYLSFRNPVDINEATGLFDYPKETPFSGIYIVTKCETNITDAVFKQRLSCVRMIGQSADFVNNPEGITKARPSKDDALAVSIVAEEKAKSSLIDETFPGILISKNSSTPVTNTSNTNIAPDYRGGYAGEATATGGGGFDPNNPNPANSIGGTVAITPAGNIAPSFAGGFAGEPTATGGGGFDPTLPQNYTGPVAPDYRGGYIPT